MSKETQPNAGSLEEKAEQETEKVVHPQPDGGSAYDKCVAAHVGQAGYCDNDGNWHQAE